MTMPFDAANYDSPVTNPVTELLEQAWSLIDKPQKWCRGQPESVDGRRQCSLSALHTATIRTPDCSFPHHVIALVTLTRAMDMPIAAHGPALASCIASFNDNHRHREVAKAWQRAIAMSRTLP
jgi:hypothetical protein